MEISFEKKKSREQNVENTNAIVKKKIRQNKKKRLKIKQRIPKWKKKGTKLLQGVWV